MSVDRWGGSMIVAHRLRPPKSVIRSGATGKNSVPRPLPKIEPTCGSSLRSGRSPKTSRRAALGTHFERRVMVLEGGKIRVFGDRPQTRLLR
jgi:hypothetical protein